MDGVIRRRIIPFSCLLLLCGCQFDNESVKAPSGVTVAVSPTNPESGERPPKLSGFFEPGNLGLLTVPGENSKETPLSIRSVDVRVEVEGRLARTVVEQVFRNHTARQTEGTYSFTLPEGASISRLAMDVEGKMMEGELVERERARKIYEQIVRKQKDPALLEWQGGNRFQTQIFPIPANGDKRVILAYEQILPRRGAHFEYRYGLPSLEGETQGSLMGSFTFTMQSRFTGTVKAERYAFQQTQRRGVTELRYAAKGFRPVGPIDVRLAVPKNQDTQLAFARHGSENFFLLDYWPNLPAMSGEGASNLVLAIDTSASIGHRQVERIRDLSKRLISMTADEGKVNVVLGDYSQKVCADKPLTRYQLDTLTSCMDSRAAGGATDLGGLITTALETAMAMDGKTNVLLITDGTASIGELDGDLIRSNISKRVGTRPVTLHTLAVGHGPDTDYLDTLAQEGGGHALRLTPVESLSAATSRVSALLNEPLLTNVTVKTSTPVEGLTPQAAVRLPRNGALAIMGRLDHGATTITIDGLYQGRPFTKQFEVRPDQNASSNLLRNFWARAVIAEMQRKSISRDKIVKTSLHYGVMSRYTSFLVLENEQAYRRFNVARRKDKERRAQFAAKGALKKSKESLGSLLQAQQAASPAPGRFRRSRGRR